MVCKTSRRPDLEGHLVVFAFSLDEMALEEEPRIRVPFERIDGVGREGVVEPSGIEIDPVTGRWYIVASAQRVLLELSSAGRVLASRQLSRAFHRQPEGITFGPDGSLFIGDEGNPGAARISAYILPLGVMREWYLQCVAVEVSSADRVKEGREMALESDAAPVEAPTSAESESATPEPESSPPESESPAEPAPAKSKKEKKEKSQTAGRGIETMFRTAYRTHLELSNLVDTKANIMISINGIIISIIVVTVSSTVAENASLLLPAAVLLLTCLGSLVFAVLAARPRVSSEVVDPELVRSGRRNILFFGNFVHMPEDEFVEGIQDLMRRKNDLYATMSRDLYSLGGVLVKKYRLIRTAYNIFIVGLTVGVTLFVIVLVMGAVVPPPPFTP